MQNNWQSHLFSFKKTALFKLGVLYRLMGRTLPQKLI
jgi:hypothetical protein